MRSESESIEWHSSGHGARYVHQIFYNARLVDVVLNSKTAAYFLNAVAPSRSYYGRERYPPGSAAALCAFRDQHPYNREHCLK